MKSNGYITIVIIAGLSLIGYLFAISPASAPTQLPLILAGIGALVAVLNKQGDTDHKVETSIAKVDHSIAVSQENAMSIATVAEQTNHGLEGVNAKVDGHLTALTTKIDDLMRKVATLEKDKAVKQIEDAHAESSEQRIIQVVTAAVAAVALPTAEIVPPTDVSPSRPGEHQ